jgi:hypothetical protein
MAQRITRDDLEGKFRSVQNDIQAKVDDKKNSLATAAVIGGVILLLVVFVLGRRAGSKRTTFVEIRRV